MKQLFVLVCFLFLASCSSSPETICSVCPDDYFMELRSETDDYGCDLKWFDVDCDGLCDGAIMFDEDGYPYAPMPCEMADQLFEKYTEMKKSMGI